MFRKILLATDGSEPSKRALQAVIELGKAFRSEVLVFHVNEKGQHSRMEFEEDAVTFRWESERNSQVLVDEAAQALRDAGVQVSTQVLGKFDSVATEIAEVAKQFNADVVVMGSTGRSAVAAALLGSVAQRVVHESGLPVLIVR